MLEGGQAEEGFWEYGRDPPPGTDWQLSLNKWNDPFPSGMHFREGSDGVKSKWQSLYYAMEHQEMSNQQSSNCWEICLTVGWPYTCRVLNKREYIFSLCFQQTVCSTLHYTLLNILLWPTEEKYGQKSLPILGRCRALLPHVRAPARRTVSSTADCRTSESTFFLCFQWRLEFKFWCKCIHSSTYCAAQRVFTTRSLTNEGSL